MNILIELDKLYEINDEYCYDIVQHYVECIMHDC